MRILRSRAWLGLVATASLVLSLAAASAQDRDPGTDFDAFLDRARAQGEGLRADWEGSVSGEFTARLGGSAKLHFAELGNGKLKVQFYLGGSHQYFNGVSAGGVVSCTRGTRTYPAWVRRSAGEAQPAGQFELYYHDGNATISRRVGVSPLPDDDTYEPEVGRLTLTLLEDRLAVKIEALMKGGPIRAGSNEAIPRIRLLATVEVERTLGNERLFDTSRCEGRVPFEVVSVKPQDGQANVLEDRAEILVELSEDVHPGSLRNPDLVVVRTLRRPPEAGTSLTDDASAREASAGNPLTPVPFALGDESTLEERVAGDTDLVEPRILRFVPHEPLRTGVRYQVDLATGDDGIRSQDFHVLEEQWPTWFTTRVKPAELRVGVYQTTRDAPLLERKPAIARVHVDWDEIPDIDPAWQVEEAAFDVRLTEERPNRTLVDTQMHRVERPDLYDDEDKRLARDSVNLFSWKPRRAHGDYLVARVRPHDPYPAVGERELPEDTGLKRVDYAASQLDELFVEPVIVQLGNWREDPPKAETIAHVMRAFVLDNEYARQVFPVVQVRAGPLGFFRPPPVAEWWHALWFQARILDDHYGQFSQADIVAGYYPPELGDGRGQGIVKYRRQQSNVVLMPVAATDWSPVPAIVAAPLVAHEYGHIFGLSHVPDVDSDGRDVLCGSLASYLEPSAGIEGFRILAGGKQGHSKSSTTGNGEEAPSLKQLMFPCQYDARAMWWISDEYYEKLVKELPGLIRGQRLTRRVMVLNPPDLRVQDGVKMDRAAQGKPPGVRWTMVSGFTDGTRTDFLPAVDVPRAGIEPGPGADHQLVAESADGTVLASRAVELHREAGQAYFSATLALAGDPARVRLLKDGNPVGELSAGAPPVAPRILSHEEGALLAAGDVLRWRAQPDAGQVRYSVRYHAGPAGPTRVLAALTDRTDLALDPASLPRGESPMLEVIAHTGLHEAGTRLPVRLPEALRPMLVHPVGLVPEQDEAVIGAWFTDGLEPGSLGDVRLLDESGAPVPAMAFVDPNGNAVRIVPEAALAPDATYSVYLSPGLKALDGRMLASTVHWTFRTREVAGEVPEPGRGPRLPRAVTPLPPVRGDAASATPAAGRATGEATVIGATAMQSPVAFTACEPSTNPSARVLLEGRFGEGVGSGRFRLERAAGDLLALSLEVQTPHGLASARLQGSPERPGEGGLVLREHPGHWYVQAMLDQGEQKVPVMLTANCGLP